MLDGCPSRRRVSDVVAAAGSARIIRVNRWGIGCRTGANAAGVAIHVASLHARFARDCQWTTTILVLANSSLGGTGLAVANSGTSAARLSFGSIRQTRYCGRNPLNPHARTTERKN
jgi:hypothetical protein